MKGSCSKKRQELVKPIQDKVYEAIQKIAKDENLDFIFDKSSDMTMLYSNAKYDKSDNILSLLGVAPTKEEKEKVKEEKKKTDLPSKGDLPPR